MKNIKAIIFDLGGVILNINYQNTINSFKNLGIKNPNLFYSKKSQTNLFDQIEIGEITEMEFLLELQKKIPKASVKKIKSAWNAMLLDLPEKRISVLRKLIPSYSIFLLSNTNVIHISEFKKKIGSKRYEEFYNLFDKVYYSYKIKCRKPHAKAFKFILNQNELAPNEVLFIDDSPQHIEGAKKLGIKTHHLQHNEEISTLFPDITLQALH